MTDAKTSEAILKVTRDEGLAHEWELVLLAQGLSPVLCRTADGIVLTISCEEEVRARAGLAEYEKENQPTLPGQDESLGSPNWLAGTIFAASLLGFFAVTVYWKSEVSWFESGSGWAEGILTGEPWRAITALTLHGDVVHAASNAAAMAVFLGVISGIVGVGLALALVVSAGAGGNLVNAWLQGPLHLSVGASTAVFGAIGVLGSLAMVRRRRTTAGKRNAWVPVAAAMALLAMLGTGGERVDVLAHLCGFLLGAALGLVAAPFAAHPPRPAVQWICAGAVLATIIYCWTLALA